MIRVREAIVVEGRYDKAALAGVVDTLILDTAGFGVFRDGEKLALLRRLAEERPSKTENPAFDQERFAALRED